MTWLSCSSQPKLLMRSWQAPALSSTSSFIHQNASTELIKTQMARRT